MLDSVDVAKLKCKIVRVRFNRDFFAICECSTETQLRPDFVCDVDSSRRFH